MSARGGGENARLLTNLDGLGGEQIARINREQLPCLHEGALETTETLGHQLRLGDVSAHLGEAELLRGARHARGQREDAARAAKTVGRHSSLHVACTTGPGSVDLEHRGTARLVRGAMLEPAGGAGALLAPPAPAAHLRVSLEACFRSVSRTT